MDEFLPDDIENHAKIEVNVKMTGPKIPRTTDYEGTLELDPLINTIMSAHAPRLADNRGNFQAAYWAYTAHERTAEILVNCNWRNEEERPGMLAFSMLPLPALHPEELIWMADVALDAASDTPISGVSSALLVVSYRTVGVYAFAFPYTRQDFGPPSYESALFTDVNVPLGFVNTALESLFIDANAEERAKYRTEHPDAPEMPADTPTNEAPIRPETKYLGAAMATAWGHIISFADAVEPPALAAIAAGTTP